MNYVLSGPAPAKPRAFIKMPIFDFHNNHLHYLDVLTYVAIKSFDNKEGKCFPSNETICKRSKLSKQFVTDSIKRLEVSKDLVVYRAPKFKAPNRSYPNHYSFPSLDNFNPVPYQLLEIEELTPYEKAMLLVLRQCSAVLVDVYGSIKDIAIKLNLTHSIVNKQFKSLLKKGYIETKRKKLSYLTKIDWFFPDYCVCRPKIEFQVSPTDLIIT